MKWISVSSQHSTIQEYQLIENGECKAIIKYNPLHRSARMSCGRQHRLFFIESAGSLSGKHIFKNEYGMEIGSSRQEKTFGKDGQVIIESTKYTYTIDTGDTTTFSVFNAANKCLVSCNYDEKNIAAITATFLLTGLCWYLLLPVTHQQLYAA